MLYFLLLLLSILPAFSQPQFTAGVKGGYVVDDALSVHYARFTTNESGIGTIGGAAGIRLNSRLGAGMDVLYRRVGQSAVSFGGVLNTRADVWETPVYGRFYPVRARLEPFVAGGYSFRSGAYQTVASTPFGGGGQRRIRESNHGGHLGAGAELRVAAWLRLTAEYRYTRWRIEATIQPRELMDRKNQHQVLLTLGF